MVCQPKSIQHIPTGIHWSISTKESNIRPPSFPQFEKKDSRNSSKKNSLFMLMEFTHETFRVSKIGWFEDGVWFLKRGARRIVFCSSSIVGDEESGTQRTSQNHWKVYGRSFLEFSQSDSGWCRFRTTHENAERSRGAFEECPQYSWWWNVNNSWISSAKKISNDHEYGKVFISSVSFRFLVIFEH